MHTLPAIPSACSVAKATMFVAAHTLTYLTKMPVPAQLLRRQGDKVNTPHDIHYFDTQVKHSSRSYT